MTDADKRAISDSARHLVRSVLYASLSTVMRDKDGAPYASMVAVATDQVGNPILLISDLADHTKNVKQDDRVSLLLIGDVGDDDPMAGERLTLQGRLKRSDDPALRQRYLARHPNAGLYADFADFGFYHMTIERAHLVAGFGRIHWLDGEALTIEPSSALLEAESDIVNHMNDDHADASKLYATRLLQQTDGDWRMTGVDPDGADFRLGNHAARLPFGQRVEESTDVRKELVRLVNQARSS
jgi:putative heme iron utilization protein